MTAPKVKAIPGGMAFSLLRPQRDYSRSDFFQLIRSPSVVLLEDEEDDDDPELPDPFGDFSRSL